MLLENNYMYLKKLYANLLRFYVWMKYSTSIFKVGGVYKSLWTSLLYILNFQSFQSRHRKIMLPFKTRPREISGTNLRCNLVLQLQRCTITYESVFLFKNKVYDRDVFHVRILGLKGINRLFLLTALKHHQGKLWESRILLTSCLAVPVNVNV